MADERDLHEDFGAFYRAHLDVVLAFCMGRTRDAELAADLAAEVFAAALIARVRFRSERGTARQWLLGIASNKIADVQRRGRVERRAQQQLGIAAIEWTADDIGHVSGLAADERLQALLAELPADQGAAIRARVLDDEPYAEIARAAGVSEQTVRKRVSRGLSTMRQRLTKEPE